MTTYDSFESMPVWQKGMDLAERVFAVTRNTSRQRGLWLTSQIFQESDLTLLSELVAHIWEGLKN